MTPRILAVAPGPNFSVADVHAGWVEGLREIGCQVADFNLDRRLDFYSQAHHEHDGVLRPSLDHEQAVSLALNGLLADCYRLQPDVLLLTSVFYMTERVVDLIRSRGTRVVMLHTESPYEDDIQITRAAHADLNLVNDPTNLDQFRAHAPTWYLPHAYRPKLHYPRNVAPERDFCFVGTGYPSRVEWLERVDWSGIDAALAGNWPDLADGSPLAPLLVHEPGECLPNEQTADLYSISRMSLNLYRREAIRPDLSAGWAMGPREVELAAMGVPFFRDPRGESDEVLPMLPAVTTPEELGDQIRWWATHDTERTEAAQAARAAVADRTFGNHARELLRLLDA